jgi:hypothetical protein
MPKKVPKRQEVKREPHPRAKDILDGIIGALVFLEAATVLLIAATIAYLRLANPVSFPDLRLFYGCILLLALLAGLCFGYRSQKRQDLFYRLFNPRKQTIILSLVFSLTWLSIGLGLGGAILFAGELTPMSTVPLSFLLAVWAVQSILFFPISSVVAYLYWNRNKIREAKIPLILALLLNPLSLTVGMMGYQTYSFHSANEPCGATIEKFVENSPARDAGMTLNETITAVDGQEIKYVRDISEYLSMHNPSESLSIRTDLGRYQVLPSTNSSGGTFLGVILYQKYCPR